MTQQELEQAHALLEGITQGEWTYQRNEATGKSVTFKRPLWELGSKDALTIRGNPQGIGYIFGADEANAAFIAQAPTLVRKLLAEVAAQKKALKQVVDRTYGKHVDVPKRVLTNRITEEDIAFIRAIAQDALKEPTP